MSDQLNPLESCFLLKFINRPYCVFKCDFGYLAYRNKQSRILECNKSLFTLFTIEEPADDIDNDGIVYLKGLCEENKAKSEFSCCFFCHIGSDGMYWDLLSDSNISVTGYEPSKFILELCSAYSRVVIKAPNGMYLRAEQNGSIQATCQYNRQATQWEF